MSTFANTPAPLAPRQIRPIATWAIGGRRLTAGLETFDRVELADHRGLHGELPRLRRSELESACASVDLRGRGGAAFPVAAKLRALPARGVGAVVVNGSESEPASWKDKLLMRRTPHLVIDGALLVASAVGAREVVVVAHDGMAAESMRVAMFERRDCARARVVDNPGWFVAGEASATIRAAEGALAVPAGRRVLPTVRGLGGRPTFLSNVETFAQLAALAMLGREFANTGVGSEPGTTLLTVGGAVERPAVVEIPTGIPLDAVLLAAGVEDHAKVLLGGYHGTFVNDTAGLSLSRATIAAHGYTLGAGVVQAIGQDTCGWREIAAVTHWLAAQTAGQCGPCVFGLPAIAADIDKIGRGIPVERDLVRHLDMLDGRGACAHPTGAVRFVRSAAAAFAGEIEVHLRGGGCGRPYLGELPMPGSLR